MREITNSKDAIKTAIQMEKDGYNFYKKAAGQTTSEMGRSVFESLAEDELVHLDVFQKMFDETVGKPEWDDLVNSSKKYQEMPVFPKDLRAVIKCWRGTNANQQRNDNDAPSKYFGV